jgi:hypothetical protein
MSGPQLDPGRSVSWRTYWCFVSSRHLDNKQPGRDWATWLHQTLEHYPVPKDLAGQIYDRDRAQPVPRFCLFQS